MKDVRFKGFLKNLVSRFSFKLNAFTWLEIAIMALVYPVVLQFSPQWFVEDGPVENLQLIVLVIIFVAALRSKYNHQLFVFVAMIILFLMMRETNLFRSWFCERYLAPGEMCRWYKMKYGFLPENLRLVYCLYAAYYFYKNRLHKTIWSYAEKAPVYVWDITILLLSAVVASVAEFPCVDSEALEESCELLCYITLGNCIYRYKSIDISTIKQ